MNAPGWFVCILSFSIVAGMACNQTPEDAAFPGAAGTSGTAVDGGAPQAAESASGREADQQAAAELPRTASPVPIAAFIAALSLGAGIGIRSLRRR